MKLPTENVTRKESFCMSTTLTTTHRTMHVLTGMAADCEDVLASCSK